ncbi:MAG TPA: hypothetical protein VKG80_23835 [Trebonia sp.]|nr:hypothetical protein [Trebonia sp.]
MSTTRATTICEVSAAPFPAPRPPAAVRGLWHGPPGRGVSRAA